MYFILPYHFTQLLIYVMQKWQLNFTWCEINSRTCISVTGRIILVTRRGAKGWGQGGPNSPPPPPPPHDFRFLFVWFVCLFVLCFACQLRGQSRTLMLPLSHYVNFATTFLQAGKKECVGPPPPPPPPPPSNFFQDWRLILTPLAKHHRAPLIYICFYIFPRYDLSKQFVMSDK